MNDEKFYTKVLGISVCFIYFIIAVCVVFIIGISRVDALSTNLTFSESNTRQFCNGSSCISANLDYPFFNWTNYYRFTPTSPWTFKVGNLHTFNLYGVSEYNVSDYDYILIH